MMRMQEDRSSDSPAKCPCQSHKNRFTPTATPQKPSFPGGGAGGQCEECATQPGPQAALPQAAGLIAQPHKPNGTAQHGHDLSKVSLFRPQTATKQEAGQDAAEHKFSISIKPPVIEPHLFDDHKKDPKKQQAPAGHEEKSAAPQDKPKDTPRKAVTTSWSDCSPSPANAATLDAIKPSIFGYTGLGPVTALDLNIHFKNNSCWTEVTSVPAFTLKGFLYAAEGDYPRGTDTADRGACRGKQQNALVHITPGVSDLTRQGEMEHCNDIHRAFNLTYLPAYAAVSALQFPRSAPDKAGCQQQVLDSVKAITGQNLMDVGNNFNCLFDTTKVRDTNQSHTLFWGEPETATYSKDCKTVTFTPLANKVLPEIGKHSSEEIVKGCKVTP